MKNFKSTKRALLTSVLSMVLCFTMLLGTTFAWFTDSVTSANNIIKSGNLDIELEYWNGTAWVDVAGKSDILTNTLWEPGVTEVAYLRVANAGSLALKYQLGVNIVSETAGVNVEGKEFLLSDYIQFGVIENVNGETGAFANRDAAVAAVSGAKKISAGYTKSSTMKSGDELYLALVVYMPTTVGNVANHNGENVPQIDLGINVIATQLASEEDSFGSDYDDDAWHPDMEVATAADLQAALNNGVTDIALADDIVLEEPIVIPAPAASTYSLRRNADAVVIDLNGKTITAGEDGYVIENANGATVVLKDSANGGEIKGVVYNANGSVMTINGGTYTAVSNYAILNDAATLTINSGTINGTAATYPIYSYNDGQQLTINDVTINGVFGALNAYGKGTVVINGGTYNMTGVAGKTSHIAYFSTTATVVINGGSFNHVGDISMAAAGGGGVCLMGSANVTINGGSFNGDYADIYNWSSNATLTINGGTFAHNPGKVAEGFNVVEANGAYHVVADGFKVIASAADLVALGGQKLEGTYVLVADINMNGAAMPTIGAAYGKTLTIVGNGHTISNATTAHTAHNGMKHHGFFYAYTNSTLTISDLTFDNIVVDATKDAERNYGAAVVVAYADGGSTVNLTNVDVKNSKVLNSIPDIGDEAGVYVGYQTGTLNMVDCDSINCVVAGETDAKTGAFVGMVNGTANVTNCTTDMTIGLCNRIGGTLTVDGAAYVIDAAGLEKAVKAGATELFLAPGVYDVYSCGGKTLTINGSKDTVLKVMNEGEAGSDYGFDGSTVTFNGVTFDTSDNNGNYKGYARMVGTYNNCTFNGSYALNKNSEFTGCTFNISGDAYNLWTWGAPVATLNGCTFNSDGKAILLYGGVDTKLTLNDCVFNDNGGLTDKKAAIEIGNDYGRSYELVVNNTVVNGYEINDKGINTGSTLWGNKNSMGTDKLNVVVDGVDVY